MEDFNLQAIVDNIKQTNEGVPITARKLFNWFGFYKRSSNNCAAVDEFLESNELTVCPHYNDVWIDNEILLMPKAKATRKNKADPIKRIKILPSAAATPLMVDNSDPIEKAITLMLMHNYSQLPVTQGSNLSGYISWETIGSARAKGESGKLVKDYKNEQVTKANPDTPLLEAINLVYKNDFIVVLGRDNKPCGIVTVTDISSQFLVQTQPYVMLEEMENQIRRMIDGVFLLEDVQDICHEHNRPVQTVDDLTFGEYVRLLENPDNWNKLPIGDKIDRKIFIEQLKQINDIRNDVMHFNPEGLAEEDIRLLTETINFLRTIL